MNKWTLLLLLAFVVGCKSSSGGGASQSSDDEDEPDGPPSYPFDFDHETAGGIQIETRGHSIPSDAEIDTWYEETLQCVSSQYAALNIQGFQEYEAPPIIIEDDLSTLCGGTANGVYCANYAEPFIGVQTDAAVIAFKWVWKHEFIHHILYMNDFDEEMNLSHQPIEIWDCQSG